MKISVIGAGYVGLVTGACLADLGLHVMCIDADKEKIGRLEAGAVPFHEPGLQTLVRSTMADGRLHFATRIADGVAGRSVVFIAVGTPPSEDGSADLRHVEAVAKAIGEAIDGFTVVAMKSTVPVGTAARVAEIISRAILARGAAHEFTVVSNPEFLKEGAAVADFMRPDRIVLGVPDSALGARARAVMEELYLPLTRNHQRTRVMDVASAELTKYAANAMLATRISFMNELAALAEAVGADIESVRQGIGSDTRIGFDFLYAGTGYGGSCFPKDIRALVRTARTHGCTTRLIEAVEEINERQKSVLVRKIEQHFGEDLSGRHFALWGLAFKPNTDDMRDAPSRDIVRELLRRGASVAAHDPVAIEEARRAIAHDLRMHPDWLERLRYANTPDAALDDADALVIATEWKAYRSPEFATMKQLLKQPLIFDGRNLYLASRMKAEGFAYHAIGKRAVGESPVPAVCSIGAVSNV